MKKILVLGGGSFGTALAHTFSLAENQVTIWARDSRVVESINTSHKNPRYLNDYDIHSSIRATNDLEKALVEHEIIIMALPTQSFSQALRPHKKTLKDKVIVNSAKGITLDTLQRVSQVLEGWGVTKYAMLSGPSFAKELLQELPTALTLGTEAESLGMMLQDTLSHQSLRIYRSNDVTGVELGGALKNIYAIATGIIDGLGLGLNTEAALINRAMTEMTRLGIKMGAKPFSFFGLSGMGDLVLTCTSQLSRNRRLGTCLGTGQTLEQAIETLGGVAEGVATTKAVHDLGSQYQVELPIMEQIYQVLYQNKSPKEAVQSLMQRDQKTEWEELQK